MSKPSALAWSPVIICVVTALVSASTTLSTVPDIRRSVDMIDQRQQAHERAAGHAESLARIRALEAESAKNAAAFELMNERLRRIDMNMAVVCQATPGAQCQR